MELALAQAPTTIVEAITATKTFADSLLADLHNLETMLATDPSIAEEAGFANALDAICTQSAEAMKTVDRILNPQRRVSCL
jgi:hypothetical protein